MTNNAAAQALILIVHICAERRGYVVTFAPGLDALAAQFIRDRRVGGYRGPTEASVLTGEGYVISENDEDEATGVNAADWPLVMDLLYPTCEHGMDANRCMGPEHFMDRQQELAMGWG